MCRPGYFVNDGNTGNTSAASPSLRTWLKLMAWCPTHVGLSKLGKGENWGAVEAMSGFGSTEPSDRQKALVDEAIYLRGRIVASYAQVEFLLADLVVKLDLHFPYLVDARIKAVKKIAERPGYEIYREELDRVCDELSQYDELRHFMTHGFLSLTMDRKDNHQFEFLRYQREGDGKFNMLAAKTTIERLRQAAQDIGEYVSHVIGLFERIYREKKLEPNASKGPSS